MKTVLITGASGEIGAAAAKLFAQNGYAVAINYLKNEKSAHKTAEDIIKNGGKSAVYKADVADSNAVFEMTGKIKKELGSIDVLINNAAVADQRMLCDVTPEIWQRIFDVNITGVFNCCRAVMEDMVYKKNGSIINVSSMWGIVGASCEVAYSASKAAVVGFTKALAKELGPSGVRVNCVSPGLIDTKMNAHLDKQSLLEIEEETPLMRSGKPLEVAETMLYLASEKASFITGQNISINGGFVM